MLSYLSDAQLDVHGQESSNEPQFFTYGNSRNSFTADSNFHDRIDYIFYKSGPNIQVTRINYEKKEFGDFTATGCRDYLGGHSNMQGIIFQVNPTAFTLPPLMADVGGQNVTITDHEPLVAEFNITRT